MTQTWVSLRRSLFCMAFLVAIGSASADDGPRVRSKTAVEQSQSGQSLDLYGTTDWASVPAWEQASYFGIRARGQVFVFVIDCSGSMGSGRLARAKQELRRTVARLRFPQRYLVIFYNDGMRVMPGGIPQGVDTAASGVLDRWLRLIEAEGATDPRSAMKLALGLQPDAVFLLSDGEFKPGTAETIAARNMTKIPIHSIDLGNGAGAESLRRIAAQSGGRYAAP